MKRFHLALSLVQFRCRGEAFADRLAAHFAGQTEVGAVASMTGPMTMAIGFSAASIDGGDGAAPKVAQLKNAQQDVRTLLFQSAEGVWQRAPQSERINTFGLYRQK